MAKSPPLRDRCNACSFQTPREDGEMQDKHRVFSRILSMCVYEHRYGAVLKCFGLAFSRFFSNWGLADRQTGTCKNAT